MIARWFRFYIKYDFSKYNHYFQNTPRVVYARSMPEIFSRLTTDPRRMDFNQTIQVWAEQDNLRFTKIWDVCACMLVYCMVY